MYRSQVGLLTGWIHHTVYVVIMIYCTTVTETPILLIGAVMEVSGGRACRKKRTC